MSAHGSGAGKLAGASSVGSVVADALPLAAPSAAPDRATRVAALYARHKAPVYAQALRFGCGDRAFAEDVLQDVFVSLLGAVDRLRDVDELGAWLRRVTVNACLNRQRRERFRRSRLAEIVLGPATVEDDPVARVDAARAHGDAVALLRALPPKERVAFCVVVVDGEPQTDLCRLLGCSKGYASKLVARSTRRVRALGWRVSP